MSINFSDIEYEIANVLESAQEADGDLEAQEAFDNYLKELAEQEADKADRIAFMLRGMAAKAESLSKLAQEISRKASSVKKAEARLREYTLAVMDAHGLSKIKGETYSLSKRASTAVRIDDECRIPIEYMQVSAEPMKNEIKAALKEGRKVPGASLIETTSLMVR